MALRLGCNRGDLHAGLEQGGKLVMLFAVVGGPGSLPAPGEAVLWAAGMGSHYLQCLVWPQGGGLDFLL